MSALPLATHFTILDDPRIDRSKQHTLLDIVVIAFCAVLCGAEGWEDMDWEDMEEFGHAKHDWLQERLGLELANGIPSDDTFRRLFARLDPEQFGRCFLSFAQSLHTYTQGEIIALDGKAVRHSFDAATGQAAIHLVSAWATESGLALGQVKVGSKSNEITAIPALLKVLDISGCVITIDAMGCQRAIAKQIVDKKADYLLSLKGNQSTLHEDVKLFFEEARAHDFYQKNEERRITHGYYETVEKDHGRIETRRCWMVQGEQLDWLWQKAEWAGLYSIGAVECERRMAEKMTVETRYFISSLRGSVQKFARAVRAHWGIENRLHWGIENRLHWGIENRLHWGIENRLHWGIENRLHWGIENRLHWGIENRLHWTLDMAFGEDACPICADHAPENLATLRKMVLNLLRQEKQNKRGLKAKSKRASWDNDYLLSVLISQSD